MARILVLFCATSFLLASTVRTGHAQFVAEQVTVGNAAMHLFQGTDADGGIDDWYLTNGVVEVIIDDVGVQTVPGGATAPPKQSEAALTGGTLIDIGLVGADNDQLGQMFTVGGLSTSNFIVYDTIMGATTASSATITATGDLLGFDPPVAASDLEVTTEYTLETGDDFLTITTTVENTSGSTATGLTGLLDAFIWTQRAVTPFSPLVDRGFSHVVLDLGNPAPALELPIFAAGPGNVGPSDGVIDPPSGATAGEVSYGILGVEVLRDPDAGGATPPTVTAVNRLFGISSNLVTALGSLPGASLAAGASLTYERRIYVGDKNDVAAVANGMLAELAPRLSFSTGTISGDIDAADDPDVAASAVVTRVTGPAITGLPDGSAMTHFRTDSTGAFSGVVLPEGTYDIEFMAAERDPVVVAGVVVTASTDTPVAPPDLSAQGFVEISVFEKIKGVGKVPVPGRVTFVGIDGTPDPRFGHDFDAFQIDGMDLNDINPESFAGGRAQVNFVYVSDATGTVNVRPGTYEVYGTRGPEYTLKRKKAKVQEGKTKKVKMNLKRVVRTRDALSADFHIHSARSFDTSPPLEDRVVSFAGEQVEVMVSSDHDYHTDYSTIITGLGLDDQVASVVGNEVTTSVPNPPAFPDALGHLNAWPVPVSADERRDGSIEDEYVAPNLLYSRLRGQGAEVVQYNHPRAGVAGLTSIGFFNNIGYDPDTVITSPPNDVLLDDDVLGPGISGVANPDAYRNIDFDVMEIANGVDIDDYLEIRRDWFSLLNQTDFSTVPFIGGTSVSDSHRVTLETAGYGRTYVLGLDDDPAALDVSAMNTNIKAGKMVGTTGPYIELTILDTAGTEVGIGETLDPATSDIRLRISVFATHWIPVEEVRIYRNGFLETSFDDTTDPGITKAKKPTSGSKKTRRFSVSNYEITLGEDSWIIVEAGQKISPIPSPDPFTDLIVPGHESVAFTNPIFIDLDGDGFDPPGLPVAPLLVARSPAVTSLDGFKIGDLPERKREEVLHHLPIHKIRIPASAVAALAGGS